MKNSFAELLTLQKTFLIKNLSSYYRLEIFENPGNRRLRGILQCAQCFYKSDGLSSEFPVIESWSSTDFEMTDYGSEAEILASVNAFLNPRSEEDMQLFM